MKQFAASVERADRSADEGIQTVEFKLGEEVFTARKPKRSAFAKVVISSRKGSSTGDQIAATLDFIIASVGEAGWRRIERRLDDSEDQLDLEDVVPIAEWLLEEFTGTPSEPQSGS